MITDKHPNEINNLIHPSKTKSFGKLKEKDQKRLIRIYEHVKKQEAKSQWHEFTIPGVPVVSQGIQYAFRGFRTFGKKKSPIIHPYMPKKAKEIKRLHKYLVPVIEKEYGFKPVVKEKVLFNWSSVEMYITFGLPKPKSLTTIQSVLAESNIGVNLGKPDTMNLYKLYEDGFKDFLVKDDSIIYVMGASKIYTDTPFIKLSIRERKRVLPSTATGKNLESLFE